MNSLQEFFNLNIDWDVVQLAHLIKEKKDYNSLICKILNGSNAAGYLVNHHMFLPLYNAIVEVIEPYIKTHTHWIYANDVVWCQFMKNEKWFGFNTKLGYQRLSYSNLAGKIVTNL